MLHKFIKIQLGINTSDYINLYIILILNILRSVCFSDY
jgi:hypothetical protein